MISQKNSLMIVVGAVLALSGSLAVTSAITPPTKPSKTTGAKKSASKAAASDSGTAATAELGQKVYAAKGCGGCHAIGGKGGDTGPALDKTASDPTRTIHWFEVQVTNPKVHNPDTTMPSFAATIKGKDLTSLATYLSGLKGTPESTPTPTPPASTPPTSPDTSAPAAAGPAVAPAILAAGKRAYGAQGCGNCHAMNGAGGGAGPDLGRTGVDPKHTIHWFAVQIVNPKAHTPDTTMPAFTQVKGKELTTMAAYLTTLKGPQETAAVPQMSAVAAPDAALVAALGKQGGVVQPLAQNDNHLDVSFHMSGPSVTDASLDMLPRLKNVVQLDLGTTGITDAGLAKIRPLTGITELHLEKTKITDKGLLALKDLRNLVYLNLYGTDVTDAGLDALSGLTNLKHLYLWQTKVTQAGADKLKKSLPGAEIVTGLEVTPVAPAAK